MPIRAWALMALLLCSTAASAEQCPIPLGADPKLAQIDPAVRLSFLRASLNTDAKLVSRWRWGWVAGFSFLTAYNFGGGFTSGPAITTHPADFVGAAEAAISVIPLVVNPPHVVHDGPAFESQAAAAAPSDSCATIAEGEKLLVEDAANEAFAAGVVTQVLNLVLNAAVVVIVGVGYKSWSSAAVTGGVGFVLGETMILTQPTNLVKQSKAYNAGLIQAAPTEVGFSIHAAGAGVAGTF